ncbi:MAG: GNAT family N-acetyltransferase [Thermoplasmata archaeon]|nr:GNAT family N-acetyltransferase [Thermoplasmata archaeon]
MTIQVVELDEDTENVFWHHVEKDPLEYYFFIMDWKYEKDHSRILMAMEEENVIGMMVIFKDSIVQVRGNREAIEALLDNLHLTEVEMMAPLEYEDIVLDRFKPGIKNEMLVMYVERGEENILKPHEPRELSPEDAEQIAKVMRESNPDWWGQRTPENIVEAMKKKHWLGFKVEEKIVSLGNAFLDDHGSVIGVVATDEEHRNKGYATSIVSGLVEDIFQKHDRALIHVLKDNHSAIHTYRKVGFKLYREYTLIKNAVRK